MSADDGKQDNITENENIQSTGQMVDLLKSKNKRNKTSTKKNALNNETFGN